MWAGAICVSVASIISALFSCFPPFLTLSTPSKPNAQVIQNKTWLEKIHCRTHIENRTFGNKLTQSSRFITRNNNQTCIYFFLLSSLFHSNLRYTCCARCCVLFVKLIFLTTHYCAHCTDADILLPQPIMSTTTELYRFDFELLLFLAICQYMLTNIKTSL